LELIAINYRKKKPFGFDISKLNDVIIKEISQYYAIRCMILWYNLKTKCKNNNGKKQEKKFNQWKEFIRSCMSIFQKGILISAMDTHGKQIQVIEPDPFLSLLQGSLNMSFKSEYYERSSKKNGSTKIENDIRECIYDAIQKDKRSPHEFSLNDITFADMDEEQFDKINVTQ
jgi:hypothetical protein